MNTETGRYLVRLLRSLLGPSDPPSLPQGVTMEDVYGAAKHHELECMAYAAAAKLRRPEEDPLFRRWREAAYLGLYQAEWQLREEERLCKSFESAGIRIMPLKGNRMRRCYPEAAWRQMADLDFLIRKEDAGSAGELLRSLGYRADTLGEVHHDVYYSREGGMVELHRALSRTNTREASLVSDPWEGTVARQGCRFVMEQDEQTFFRYFLLHYRSHFYYGGIGIRSVLDLWLYRRQHGALFEKGLPALEDRLRRDGLMDFYIMVSDLADAWFGGDTADFDRIDAGLEAYVMRSGAKGRLDQLAANRRAGFTDDFRTAGLGGAGYLFRRAFPGPEVMKGQFPALEGRMYLLPACWVFRILRQTLSAERRTRMKTETKAVLENRTEQMKAPDARKLAERWTGSGQ